MKPSFSLLVLLPTLFFLIRAELLDRQLQVYVLKPLATLIVIAVAVLSFAAPNHNLLYSMGVLIGLLFSLGGDIALMFQQNRKAFMIGLIFFLLAHIAYTLIFSLWGRFTTWDILSAMVLFTAAALFYRLIHSGLANMKTPVIIYMVIISAMVHRATASFASPVFSKHQAAAIIGGALLFYMSDIVLAANRFWKPLKYHRLSLALYYSGQWLIAWSASGFAA
ncbi:MAG: lysoplasmalogenase [Calditrichaeota bacterium]|nr:MAG: lysoplasmalogenase [Calditrichota bacterium]